MSKVGYLIISNSNTLRSGYNVSVHMCETFEEALSHAKRCVADAVGVSAFICEATHKVYKDSEDNIATGYCVTIDNMSEEDSAKREAHRQRERERVLGAINSNTVEWTNYFSSNPWLFQADSPRQAPEDDVIRYRTAAIHRYPRSALEDQQQRQAQREAEQRRMYEQYVSNFVARRNLDDMGGTV